jgi:hypothetical protein
MPKWLERVRELRHSIENHSDEEIIYDASIQKQLEAIDQFITKCGRAVQTMMRQEKRQLMVQDLVCGARRSSYTKIDEMLRKIQTKCGTAAHRFLRESWNYNCKELVEIQQLMQTLCNCPWPAAADGERGKMRHFEYDEDLDGERGKRQRQG